MNFDLEYLIKKASDKIPKMKCPVCGENTFNIAEGFTRRMLSEEIHKAKIEGKSIPSVSIICTNCGYILDFSLGVWGLLEKEEEKDNYGRKNNHKKSS